MSWATDIRVVIGLDFGTTYSGFSLYHCEAEDIGDIRYRPKLPEPLTYKKAITDYLYEMGKLAKENVHKFWPGIDFMENVLIVLTIPAEYSENDKAIMRDCIYNAKLINNKFSEKLQITTEPEAAAIYCLYSSLKEHKLTKSGTNFMVVDCGGGTVDLTTRKLLEENQLE
ncbi:unnamed protein product [Rhizophagus irregularis]|uniref:Actin-like ATPase domain-containing protein n=1 Tax=Rhizophagus irregularis TaxID=588596 RepID=A0A915ZNK0_9GLOM|nr:unnamed protein product [Rhizophagus irregularis]